jgi:hypothetical protein
LSHTSSCFCRFAIPFNSFATLGTVLPNTENGTGMKLTESLISGASYASLLAAGSL